MRVLVTRPQESAARTAGLLEERGHEPVLLPLFRAEHDVAAASSATDHPASALIVTSAEAIRAIAAANTLPASFLSLPVFAVGGKTADAARKAGFARAIAANGDGAALADLIAAHLTNASKTPLLYLAGEPRSPALEEALDRLDLPARTVTVYRMQPIDYSFAELNAVFAAPIDAVLLYSYETARRFFALLDGLDGTPGIAARFLCLSAKVAEAVPPVYANRINVAKTPSEHSLLALL